MHKALIEGGRVTRIAAARIAQSVGGTWVNADEGCVIGAVYDAATGGFSPYVAAVTAENVKAEANRRILDVCPEWKQRNLTAQAAILAEKGRDNWTQEDAAAWAAGSLIWGRIAAIRTASDALEALTPIPADFADDGHWPA